MYHATHGMTLDFELRILKKFAGEEGLIKLLPNLVGNGYFPYERSLKKVLDGETTFENMLQPLLEAIKAINPHTGTKAQFAIVALEVQKDLRGVINENVLYMLIEPIPSRRKAFWSEYWPIALVHLLGFAALMFMMHSVGLSLDQMWPVLPLVLLAALILAVLKTSWPSEIIASRSRLAAATLESLRELDGIVVEARKQA